MTDDAANGEPTIDDATIEEEAQIEDDPKTGPLILLSVLFFFVPWVLVTVLLWLFTFLADLGAFGVDLLSYYTAAIALCPAIGLLFGALAVRRDVGTDWPLKPPKRLTVIALSLNLVNGFALALSKGFIMKR